MMSQHAFMFFLPGCPPSGLRLYDVALGLLLDTQPLPAGDGAFSFDITALGLAAGSYQLGVTAVNEYGCESEQSSIEVNVSGLGDVEVELIAPQEVVATAEAAGAVRIEWSAYEVGNTDLQTKPAAFEIAIPSSPVTAAVTVLWNDSRRFGYLFGPGETGVYFVRSSDGVVGGQRGEWIAANSVTTDAAGPPAPSIDTTVLPEGCECD